MSWTRYDARYDVELPQIRGAVDYLREHFRTQHPLIHHDMLTDGKHLFVEGRGSEGCHQRIQAGPAGKAGSDRPASAARGVGQ